MVGAEIVHADTGTPGRLNGELAKAIKRACFAQGLIVETGGRHGAVLRFLPPLIISEQEIDDVLKRLEAALITVHKGDAIADAIADAAPRIPQSAW